MRDPTDDFERIFDLILTQAFSKGRPPSAEEAVGDWSEISWKAYVEVYQARLWTDVPLRFLDPSVWALTDSGFVYYLPAYMKAALNGHLTDLHPLLSMLYTPGVPSDSCVPEVTWRRAFLRWAVLMKTLTFAQKRAVRLWLLEIRRRLEGGLLDGHDLCDPNRLSIMLSNYWDQFQ